MAARIGSLYVDLTADVRPFVQGMGRAQSATTSATAKIGRSVGVADKSVQSFWGSVGGQNIRPYSLIAVSRAFDSVSARAGLLRGSMLAATAVIGGFTTALTTNVLLRYADSFVKLNNQIRVVSDSSEDAAARFAEIQKVATRSRSGLEATALLYSRIQKATPDRSALEILQYVETIQKALNLGGATAEEARSAAIQFSQAIASNRLSGDEIRAILETPLGLELAKGIGVTIGKLREMGQAGELTAEKVLSGLANIKKSVDERFAISVKTIDQSLTFVDNKLTEYIGGVNQAYGVTKLLAGSIIGIGNNLETIIPLLAKAGLLAGALFAARNPALLAAGIGAAAGGIVGSQIGGVSGGLIGTVIGGLIGAKAPDSLKEVGKGAEEARARVITLREEVGKLQTALVDVEMKRSTLAKAVVGDSSAFADRSAVSALERAEFQANKAREATLKSFNDLRQAQRDLGKIEPSVSGRALKLADDQAAAEARVAAGLQRQADIRKEMVGAKTQETAALGLQATTGKLQAANDATKQRVALEKEAVSVEKSLARDRATIADREIRIAGLVADADKRAAEDRLAAQRKITAAQQTYVNNRLRFGVAGLDVNEARSGVVVSGDRNARSQLEDQTRLAEQVRTAQRGAAAELNEVTKATTKWGQATSFAGRQVSSVIGLFGGPWGVAITAAIVGLGYYASAIQKANNLLKQYSDQYDEISSKGPLKIPGSDEEGLDKAEKRVKALKQIAEAEEVVSDARARLTGARVSDLFTGGFSLDLFGTSGAGRVREISTAFADGKISAKEFAVQLAEIQKSRPDWGPWIASLIEAARALEVGREKAELAKKAFDNLGTAPYGIMQSLELDDMRTALKEIDGSTEKIISKMRDELEVSKLLAQGKTAEAAALKKAQEALRGEGNKAPQIVDIDAITRQERLNESVKEAARDFHRAEEAAKAFKERLNEFRQEAAGAFLPDVDQEVLKAAAKLKNADKIMADYIAGIKSGDVSKVDPRLLQYRQGVLEKQAGEEAREIVQQYGDWSRIAPLVRIEQEKLNIAVSNGAITASQAGVAFADFITKFGNYKWIDSTADAFGTFIDQSLDGVTSLDDALKNLSNSIRKMVIQELVTNPFKNFLRSTLADVVAGGAKGKGVGGGIASMFGGTGSIATMNATVGVLNVSGGVGGMAGKALGYATTAVGGSDLDRAAAAIRKIESGSLAGDYSRLGPLTASGDRAYGAYQIMGNNVGPWSEKWYGQRLTPDEMLKNPAAQDQMFQGQFGMYAGKYGMNGAARAWFAGEGGMNRMGAQDVLGTSVSGYEKEFQKLTTSMEGATAQTGNLSTGLTDVSADLSQASGGIGQFGASIGKMLSSLFSSFGGSGTPVDFTGGEAGFELRRGGIVGRFAPGGFVSGPGGPTSDSIRAWLSNGEFVTNAKATRKYRPLLEAINSGRGFAEGGYVANADRMLSAQMRRRSMAGYAGLAANSNRGSGVEINIHQAPGTSSTVEESNKDGRRQVDIFQMVEDKARQTTLKTIGTGEADSVFGERFSASPSVMRR